MNEYQKLAQKIAKNILKFEDNIEFIGNGSFAFVYKAGNKVIKLTTDEHDAIVSYNNIGRNLRHVVNTHNVYYNEDINMFIIINDYVQTQSDDRLVDFLSWVGGINADKFRENDIEYINERLDKPKSRMNENEYHIIRHNIIEMLDEVRSIGMQAIDLHDNNVFYDINGQLILIDVGWKSSDKNKQEIIEILTKN